MKRKKKINPLAERVHLNLRKKEDPRERRKAQCKSKLNIYPSFSAPICRATRCMQEQCKLLSQHL
jgi:hypothetical protein